MIIYLEHPKQFYDIYDRHEEILRKKLKNPTNDKPVYLILGNNTSIHKIERCLILFQKYHIPYQILHTGDIETYVYELILDEQYYYSQYNKTLEFNQNVVKLLTYPQYEILLNSLLEFWEINDASPLKIKVDGKKYSYNDMRKCKDKLNILKIPFVIIH